jgi:hypothetical protein
VRTRTIGWLLAASVATFGFQTDPKSKASIEGQVVNQASGAPLQNATVKLQRVAGYSQDPLIQQTNEEGRFLFVNLQLGDWELSADQRGFVPGNYGGRRFLPQGSRISLKADRQIRELVIKLVPQATIAGRVLNIAGEPVEGARVAVLKARYANGVPHWSEVAFATTLDNGEYRIPRVAAGRYLVMCTIARIARAPSSSGIETGDAATYHPNATEPSLAAAIDVQDGSEIGGIDVRVASTRVFHVRGRLQPPTARQAPSYVALVDRADQAKRFAGFGPVPPDYLFDIPRVQPGSYIAYGWWIDGGQYIASQPVDVRDQDVDSLVLSPVWASEILGSMELRPAGRQVDLRALFVEIRPIGLAGKSVPSAPLKIGGDLKFRFAIPVNPYFSAFAVGVSGVPQDCYLASVRYGGRDVPDSGIEFLSGAALEISIGTDGGRVDGNALNRDDTPFEGAVVALIPADGKGGSRSMISGTKGAFHLTGVPPGEYKLMAWDDVGRDDLENPDFIKRFDSQGTPVKLPASGTATESIRVISQELVR